MHEAGLVFDRIRVDLETGEGGFLGGGGGGGPPGKTACRRVWCEANETDRRRWRLHRDQSQGLCSSAGDGQLLTENVAILADRDPKLAPSADLGRTRLIEMLAFIATELHKPFGRFFFPTSDVEKV